MKKLCLALLLLLISTNSVFSQKNFDIKDHYKDFIKISRNSDEGQDYLERENFQVDSKSVIATMVNDTFYIDYFLVNFASFDRDSELLKAKGAAELQRLFIKSLQSDTAFSKVMEELAAKTIERKLPKDSLTFDQVMDIAVKFFGILSIADNGGYRVKMCSGTNDLVQTEENRLPQVEAFCFSAMFNKMDNDELNMYDEFISKVKDLYKINFGNDKDERLLRSQGAMYMLMFNDEKLKKVLWKYYQERKEFLPFVIIPDDDPNPKNHP